MMPLNNVPITMNGKRWIRVFSGKRVGAVTVGNAAIYCKLVCPVTVEAITPVMCASSGGRGQGTETDG